MLKEFVEPPPGGSLRPALLHAVPSNQTAFHELGGLSLAFTGLERLPSRCVSPCSLPMLVLCCVSLFYVVVKSLSVSYFATFIQKFFYLMYVFYFT